MIFILFCVIIVAFFIFWTVLPRTKGNKITGEILAALIILITAFMIANLHWHVGMKKVTSTTYDPIYSVKKGENVLLAKPIDKFGNQVVVYNETPNAKKPKVEKPLQTKNIIKENAPENDIQTTETNWEYSNHFLAFLFAGARQKELIHKTNVFHVRPDTKILPIDKVK